ncbi:MAG TPA: cytochrome P450 [Rhodopila sp.]|uniref:cytochrome P450 n=1 Tax=Rhodopila sp. TaxID=2480087 RepID=UPI002BC6B0C1|nr:cytochrome P450 [Rhodopila sp.]HVY17576.1 cytochrome P450 [Rhodopila sp.]
MSDHVLRPPVPPPPPRPLALRAFLRAVRTNALTIWPQSAYRDLVTSARLFGRQNILMNDPDGIHHILVANAPNYRRSRASVRILRPITGSGLLLSEGESWKVQRRTVAPALAPRVMPILVRHVRQALDQFSSGLEARTGDTVDLLAEMQRLALDIAARAMFSLDVTQYGDAIRDLLTAFAVRHSRPTFMDMVLPHTIPTWADIKRAGFRRRWMGLIETILASRLQTPADPPRDLLDLLRGARDPETGEAFGPERLRDQVATLLLAGHETTAVTLFWALFLLAQSPDDMDKIVQEAEAIPPDAEPDVVLQGLVHTRAVINETLRLYPPAFTMVREAIAADRIGSLEVRPRSIVMIAPWVLHRDEAFWQEPDRFLPSRFLPGAPPVGKFSFLPFGVGPRVCVGAHFAITEATLVLATLLRRFTFELQSPVHPRPVGIVTTQPDRPLPVRVSVRKRALADAI